MAIPAGLLIESKITAPVHVDQIRRHLATATRRGFDKTRLILISIEGHRDYLPKHARGVSWKQVYSWLRKHAQRSHWAAETAEFLEIVEARMSEGEGSLEGSLTEFTGFPFGPRRAYEYGEAKRVLRLALDELRERHDLRREIGMDPTGKGRPAITGRAAHSVWDFLTLRASQGAQQFTAYPHLTLALEIDRAVAHVTIPNGLNRSLRRRLLGLSPEEFGALLSNVERRLRPVVRSASAAAPWFVGTQRHYPTQRSLPIVDARIEFDLRTVTSALGGGGNAVKAQPAFLAAAYEALRNRGPNFQMAIGLIVPRLFGCQNPPGVRPGCAHLDRMQTTSRCGLGVWLSSQLSIPTLHEILMRLVELS